MERKITIKKIFTALILALTLAVALPTTMSVDAAGAKLNKTKVTVCTGKSYTLKMSGVSKKVSWTTSNKKIVSVTKKSGKKAEKCTIKANKKGTATVTAKVKVGKKTKTFKCKVTVKGHSYSKPSYAWNKDFSKCTATKECTRCHKKLTQTVKTSKKTTTKATCTEKGKKKYTAQFSKYSFGTKAKSVTIKAKGHKVNFDKKISYKWGEKWHSVVGEGSYYYYPKCTATYYCKYGGEKQKETVNTSEKTTPATKTSKGKTVYTATFKTKGLETQTKTRVIPKLVYLTLNGKEVNSVTVRSDRPVTVKVHNATIEQVETSTSKTVCTIKDNNQMTISTKDKIASVENVTATIWTQNGQCVDCAVKVMFTPGEYNFGRIGTLPTGGYRGYGKQKGTYGNDGYYIMDCNTKKDYDDAYRFYHERKDRNGSICDLEQKTQDIYSECYERADYYNDYMDALIAQYGSVGQIYASCDDELYNYLILTSADSTGFNGIVESQSQVDFIVTAWANKYNNGEMPSWYYPTVFSDWAEWSGADLGYNTNSYYEFRGLN